MALDRSRDPARVTEIGADADDHASALASLCATPIHGGAHRPHRLAEPNHDRLADQEVTDIELDEFGQGRNRLGGLVVQAMAGMHFEASPCGYPGASPNAPEF